MGRLRAFAMIWKVLNTAFTFKASGDNGIRMLEEGGCEVSTTGRPCPLNVESLKSELPGVDAVVAGSDDFCAEVLGAKEAKDLEAAEKETEDLAAQAKEGAAKAKAAEIDEKHGISDDDDELWAAKQRRRGRKGKFVAANEVDEIRRFVAAAALGAPGMGWHVPSAVITCSRGARPSAPSLCPIASCVCCT